VAKALENLIFHIDSPAASAEVESLNVAIKGWVAYPRSQHIEEVTVATPAGGIPLPLQVRPDVAASVPHLNSSGFGGVVDTAELSAPISILFRFRDGAVEQRVLNFRISESSVEEFSQRKKSKLARILSIIRCPHCEAGIKADVGGATITCSACGSVYSRNANALDFLSETLRSHANIFAVDAVSSNEYDPTTLDLIARHRDGLVLDDGSGFRSTYYPNVVNFDVVGYKTTDVIGIGESMPFRDCSFDAVISVAVLEHVRNPFEAAQEIERVLKPGGEVYIAVPFLQPFHGYPDHYYNMTSSGLRNLFPNLVETAMSVPPSGLPVWALSWILNAWANGLPPEERREFCSLSISDLMADPLTLLNKKYVRTLPDAVNEQLACVNVFRATKPKV